MGVDCGIISRRFKCRLFVFPKGLVAIVGISVLLAYFTVTVMLAGQEISGRRRGLDKRTREIVSVDRGEQDLLKKTERNGDVSRQPRPKTTENSKRINLDSILKKMNNISYVPSNPAVTLSKATTEEEFLIIDKIVADLQNAFPFQTEHVVKSDLKLNKTTRTYEKDGKPFLWMFWEGNTRAAYVDLCILSTVCHNHNTFNVRVLNVSEFNKSVSFVHPGFQGLSLPHKADYFRVAMLNDYGGVYFDSDTVSLESMDKLYNMLDRFDIVSASSYVDSIHFGNMGPMRARTPFTQSWLSQLHKKYHQRLKILKTRDPFHWSEVGGHVAVPTLDKLLSLRKIKYHKLKGPASWIQFNDKQVMAEGSDIVKNMKESELISLNNKLYPVQYKNKSIREILRSPVGLSQLLRYSLIKCWTEL